MNDLLEECAEAAHDAWLDEKLRRQIKCWPNEKGIEQMVRYKDLDEDVKEFDRIVVAAIIKVLKNKGLAI